MILSRIIKNNDQILNMIAILNKYINNIVVKMNYYHTNHFYIKIQKNWTY